MPHTIVLDCDPGIDDAVAFLLALGDPRIEIAAVTTVAGNQSVAVGSENACGLAGMFGLTAPVAAGCIRPLSGAAPESSRHGVTGLGGVLLAAEAVSPDPRHGVDLIIETILAQPARQVTLVGLGPLTNIAMAVRREPRIVPRVRQVVLTGGSTRPAEDFNIRSDPEAAHIVISAAWPVTMVGLTVTRQVLASKEILARIDRLDTRAAQLATRLLRAYGEVYRRRGFASPPVHDPCAVAAVIDPSVLRTRRVPVAVELTGSRRGAVTAEPRRGGLHRTRVAVGIDTARFWDLVIDALRRLS